MAGPNHLPSRRCGHAPIILPGKLNPFHVFTRAVIRPPKLTVLCRSRERVWFLLQRGQFHLSRSTQASAPLSTGVYPVRRTTGQLLEICRRVQIAVHDLPACRVLTAKGAVLQRQLLVHPAAPAARLGGLLP